VVNFAERRSVFTLLSSLEFIFGSLTKHLFVTRGMACSAVVFVSLTVTGLYKKTQRSTAICINLGNALVAKILSLIGFNRMQ